MKSAYEIINEDFAKTKRDTSFSPSLLDELEDYQRKEIEGKIIKLCLDGDRVSFQYIDKLKFYNPEDVFTLESMKKLSIYDQSSIYLILYNKTGNKDYLNKIIDNSKSDVNTYSMLSLMYLNSDNDKDDLYNSLKEISNNSEIHKTIFEVRCISSQDEDLVEPSISQ